MRRDFLRAAQVYVARSSITPSALRGRSAGTIGAARDYLSRLPLGQFGVGSGKLFYARLDRATESLRISLPRSDRFWGISRKALNIFLRNAFYNTYLKERYRLGAAEFLLEVPLDSITSSKLHGDAKPKELPRWKGVMYLQPEENRIYQEVARRVANQERIAPVHLDVYWWGGDRTSGS